MSTSQLALVISDLDFFEREGQVSRMNGKSLQVRVWARKEFIQSLTAVPDKIVIIVNYLQDYFNSSLGVPKLDVMAIPMYRATKASDNWGLMFFKYAVRISVHPLISSRETNKSSCRESELSSPLFWTTTYELLYQWIGQSITPYRRNDAPVNKALNSFLASMATLDVSFCTCLLIFRLRKVNNDQLYIMHFKRVAAQSDRDGREMADDDVVPSLLRICAAGTFLQSCWY